MRVVVVDDNDLWRSTLVAALASRGIVVSIEATDGDDLLEKLKTPTSEPIDVAILDLRLPPTWSDEGITLASTLRKHFPEIGIIILSGYEKDVQLHYAARALRDIGGTGGMGYLFKDRTSRANLKEAVQRVADGRMVVDPLFSQEAADGYRHGSPQPDTFSDRDLRVLELLVQGLTNSEIAEKLHFSTAVVERSLTKIFNTILPSAVGSVDAVSANDSRRENRRVLAVLEWLRRTGRLS